MKVAGLVLHSGADMIFMKRIPHATNEEWGICEKCSAIDPTSMLCGDCLRKRSEHFHNQVKQVESSLEYRFRNWLYKLFKPEIRFGK